MRSAQLFRQISEPVDEFRGLIDPFRGLLDEFREPIDPFNHPVDWFGEPVWECSRSFSPLSPTQLHRGGERVRVRGEATGEIDPSP
jgi:hypothetical protein